VQTHGENRHNCLHCEYNGAAMFAAPIIAYTDMFTMWMCTVYTWFGMVLQMEKYLKGRSVANS
jgi:hypothetical protein